MSKKEQEGFKQFYIEVYKAYRKCDREYIQVGDEVSKISARILYQETEELTDLWTNVFHKGLETILQWELEVDREYERYLEWSE